LPAGSFFAGVECRARANEGLTAASLTGIKFDLRRMKQADQASGGTGRRDRILIRNAKLFVGNLGVY
jgi:hypothetical protein